MTRLSDVEVPFVDLRPVNDAVRSEVLAGWERILERSQFVGGPTVESFEGRFARYCGVEHCIGVANGTDALEIALRALGIGPGDEVVVPALTFAASGLSVMRAGATPVFCDVDPDTLLIDPDHAATVIGARTSAIVAVNLYGQIAPLERLTRLASRHGLAVIEDGAQSQGARRHGRRVGEDSAFYCTSFYPTKNLGAWGDGGALLTRDDRLADRARALRNYGSARKYDHREFGFNSRLDPVQACVVDAKLGRLDRWNQERAAAARCYEDLLMAQPLLRLPVTDEGNEHVWHLYTVRLPARDRMAAVLERSNVATGVHYPDPLHLLPVFAPLGGRPGMLPVAEDAAATLLSLPLFVGMTAEQQARVAQVVSMACPEVAA